MTRNAQLSERERTAVYTDLDTKRILGFSPEMISMIVAPGIRYDKRVLYSAGEIERQAEKFRQQKIADAEQSTERQMARESIFRNAVRAKIRERNAHVNPLNRDLNEAFIRLNDMQYAKRMKAQAAPDVFLASEAYDESWSGEDLALEQKRILNTN